MVAFMVIRLLVRYLIYFLISYVFSNIMCWAWDKEGIYYDETEYQELYMDLEKNIDYEFYAKINKNLYRGKNDTNR